MASKTRYFAFIVYPDSAPAHWLDNLTSQHVFAAVSPLHDKDIFEEDNPNTGAKKGDYKKPHYHILLKFDGVKTVKQICEFVQAVLELPEPPKSADIEVVKSLGGYYRYLAHLDDKDKAQYNPDEIQHLCGCSSADFVKDKQGEWKVLKDIIQYCSENGITSYSCLVDYCATQNFDWFIVVCGRFSYVINSYLKSLASD